MRKDESGNPINVYKKGERILMTKDVIHDPIFLALKSETAAIEDLQVAQDLLDTLTANKDIHLSCPIH